MLEWFIIGVIVLVALMFLRFKHAQHKIFLVLLILLLVFVFTSATKIVKDNNVDTKSIEGVVMAGKLYFSWLSNVFHNSRVLAGNAVKMNWTSISNSSLK